MIAKEILETLEYLNQSIIQTRNSTINNLPEEELIIDQASRSEGSVTEDMLLPMMSDIIESLIDIKDYIKIRSPFGHESYILKFSSINCLQYSLFQSLFYFQYHPNIKIAVRYLMDAFKYVQNYSNYKSYFPIMTFRSLVHKLQITELAELLIDAGKLKSLLNEIYETKLKSIGTLSKDEEKKLANIKNTIIANESKRELNVSYLNDLKRLPKLISRDPNVIIVSALKDLIVILNYYKKMGSNMFTAAKHFTQFNLIEKQVAALKVCLL